MHFKETIYPFNKWEIVKLKVLSIFSKRAKEQLKYVRLDMYYWYKWQRQMYQYCKLDDIKELISNIKWR